jgi:hypothetical protein
MTESVERLHGELEEFPGAFEEHAEAPDTSSVTPLIDEANKLAEALARFRGGEHGTWRNVGTRSRRPGFEPHRKPRPASDVRAAWSIQRVGSRPTSSTLM